MGLIICIFTTVGDMVLDPFMDTGATAYVCLLEQLHCNFTGCDADCEYAVNMIPSVLHVRAKFFFNPKLDITEREEFQKAAK